MPPFWGSKIERGHDFRLSVNFPKKTASLSLPLSDLPAIHSGGEILAMGRDVRSDKTRLTFQLIKRRDRQSVCPAALPGCDDNRPLMYTCILGDNADDEKWSRFPFPLTHLSLRSGILSFKRYFMPHKSAFSETLPRSDSSRRQ